MPGIQISGGPPVPQAIIRVMHSERGGPKLMLAIGILLRVVVFLFLAPSNNDDHGDVIRLLVERGHLPTLWDTLQAQHPPLYYLLAAPIWHWTASFKAVQLLSLVFSIATLLVLYHLVYQTPLIPDERARTYGFLIACFLPQFVMFSLYVSNDTLAILLGNLAILQAWRYFQSGSLRDEALLGALTAAGLLTKLTFLAYLPVFAALVWWVRGRDRRALLAAAAFFTLTFAAGSYKLADNYARFGDPMITGLDRRFHYRNLQQHADTYRGILSYLDFNVANLIREPVLSTSTSGSYPLILYATFWYQYIPESSFIGNRSAPWKYLGSVIYIVGLLPTAVCLVGWLGCLWGGLPARPAGDSLMRYLSALLILFTGLMFVPAMLKYHVWSVVQARYLFPAMFACIAVFAEGMRVASRARPALSVCMWVLAALFAVYFASECLRWV
jgi:hypothetical protein